MSEKLIPTWVYHPEEEAKIIELPAGACAPAGWFFSPADFRTAANAAKDVHESDDEDRASVIADLEDLGVEFNNRWGLKRLIELRNEALG